MNYYITQKELAETFGVSLSYITKLKKQGVFDLCFEGRRLIRDCAIKAFKDRPQDPSRDSQREANKRRRQKEPIKEVEEFDEEKKIEELTSKKIKSNKALYNNKSKEELLIYLRGAKTPNQKVQIIKDFWLGKINEQKFLESKRLLIPKEQIIKDVQRILKAFRDKTLALPTKMSRDLIGLTNEIEVAAVVEKYVYELLEELSELKDAI